MKLSTTAIVARNCALGSAALALFLTLVMVNGCASKKAAGKLPQVREDVKELRQVNDDAIQVIQAALRSLRQVETQIPCPPATYLTFSNDVQRLEVDSFKIRARAQAIRARGQGYFEQWHQHLATLEDPQVRQRAIERHDLLQKSFEKIRDSAQQAREAFHPFMSSVRRLRNLLENDPDAARADATKALIQAAHQDGAKAEAGLTDIRNELDTVTDLLKQVKLKQ